MFGGGGGMAGKAGASDGGSGGGRARPEVVLEEGKYVQVRNSTLNCIFSVRGCVILVHDVGFT